MPRLSPRAGVALALASAGVGLAVAGVLLSGGDDDGSGTPPGSTTTAVGGTTTSTAVTSSTPGTVIGGPSTTTATTAPGAPATSELKLELRGLGPVRMGMTVPQASAAFGRTLRSLGDAAGEACRLYVPEGGPEGLAFTDGTKVTALRAGKLPEVEFVEGCV